MRLLELPQERATATTDQQNARAHGNHRNGNTCDAQFKFWSEKNGYVPQVFFPEAWNLIKSGKKMQVTFWNRCDAQIGSHTPTHISMIIYVSISVYIYTYVFISSRLVNCRILWTHICGTCSQSSWTSPEQRDAPHWKSGQVQLKNLRQNPVKPPEVRGPQTRQTSCMKFFESWYTLIYLNTVWVFVWNIFLDRGLSFQYYLYFDVSTLEYYVRIFLVNLFFHSFIYATEKRCCQQAAGVFLSVFNSSPNDQHILVHSFPFQAACHPNTLRWSYGLWLCFCVSRVFLRARKLLLLYIYTQVFQVQNTHTHIVVPNLSV